MAGWDEAGQVAGTQAAFGDWEELLAENPSVLWGLVADVVKAVKASEGQRRTGRRPAVSVRSLDELYEVLFPACYETLPFAKALASLLEAGCVSQHAFALTVGFNQATVSRLISGKTPPTVETIERVAYHLGVHPTYFHEYRAMKIGQVVTDVLLADPMLSTVAVRRLAKVRA